jgi:hypothetical protein
MLDGKDIWATVADGQPSPHKDILVNVEAFRGAVIKGKWKLVQIALLPGKTELFDLTADSGEKNNFADQNPDVVKDLESRLIAYAKEQKMSEWLKAQPATSVRRVRRSSIPTSTSTMAACRARRRRCQRSE